MTKHKSHRPYQPRLNDLFLPVQELPEALRAFEGIPPAELKAYAAKHPEKWRQAIEALGRKLGETA